MVPLKKESATDSQDSKEDKPLQTPYENVWAAVFGAFQERFGEARFESWLKHLSYKNFFSGRLIVSTPNRFMRDWIEAHCARDILALLQAQDPSILALDIVVSQNAAHPSSKPPSSDPSDPRPSKDISPSLGKTETFDQQDELGSRLEPRYTFENFVVGKPNELAYAAAQRVAESRTVTFNPLFLYGGVGLGKTHLMHAIAWHIRQHHPERRVVYLSAEKFMYHFIRALRFRDVMSFKEQFRSADVLMIDDFQFISGKESTQEEFFHTFNALVDQNHQVIISADKSPSDLEGLEERLRSRLGWGLVADIHPTTYELRLGILTAKAETMDRKVPLPVIEFLAHRITSNVRELEGALTRIVAHSMLVGREITLESTQDVLRDLLRANDRRVTIEEIQKKVAEHFGIRASEMHSNKRLRAIARPRQVAMYLAKNLTTLSLPEIGRKFGGRDHTTVIHGVQKIEELLTSDPSLSEDVDLLKRMLQGQ